LTGQKVSSLQKKVLYSILARPIREIRCSARFSTLFILMKKTTEADSLYPELDRMSTQQLLASINHEDQSIAFSVEKELGAVGELVEAILPRMQSGGRLFYIGAGTSGRLGILDASECPPTFGVPEGLVRGLIAGGDGAIRKAVEFAEDDTRQGWKDLEEQGIGKGDSVIGITASGSTPYVLGALEKCNEAGIFTGGISCNKNSALAAIARVVVECETGPEFITGSTRMKAGTAQKLILNMISSSLMIRLGRVKGSSMVDMQLSNSKLVDRGTRMIVASSGLEYEQAKLLLLREGSVRKALKSLSES
jgi:N-acetylmuramic acid 6-phosphate etherase